MSNLFVSVDNGDSLRMIAKRAIAADRKALAEQGYVIVRIHESVERLDGYPQI